MDGQLDVSLGPSAAPGPCATARRTVLRHIRHRQPLQLGRLLYPDPALPEMAFLYVSLLGGGLVQGDRLSVRVHLEPDARAHVTTVAATRIYGMPRGAATQRIDLTAGAGAVLEWWPDPVIPFRDARFVQDVTLTVDPGAVLVYGDLLLPGRAAREERHVYASFASRVTARRPDGTLLFVDSQALAPAPPGAPPFLETLPPGLDTVGTVYVLAPEGALDDLAPALSAAAAVVEVPGARVMGGASRLPAGCGTALRFLAADGHTGRRALHRAWAASRQVLLHAPPPDLRKQ